MFKLLGRYAEAQKDQRTAETLLRKLEQHDEQEDYIF